jgi:hypothetical protein
VYNLAITNSCTHANSDVYMKYKTLGSSIYKQRGAGKIKAVSIEIKT